MNREIENVKFGINLIDSAIFELKFLKKVDDLKYLYRTLNINEAVRRYETLWLPLMRDYAGVITAPIDIYWIWHTHMLCPVSYRKDLNAKIGKVLDHQFFKDDQYNSAMVSLKDMWLRKYPLEIFESIEIDSENNFISTFSYDIKSAVMRQASFFYQVSLPHYKNISFLEKSLFRYKMFLTLKKQYPSKVIVPCYDIDIIWHTHQLHPSIYAKDTIQILGHILPHDDSVNDRSPDSRLTITAKDTRSIWIKYFKESFTKSGSMYRGESCVGKLNDVDMTYLYTMSPKIVELNTVLGTELMTQHKSILKILLISNNAQDKTICSYDYHRRKYKYKCDTFLFSTYDNVGFRIKLFRKVGICARKLKYQNQLLTFQDFDTFTFSSIGSKAVYKLELLQNKKVFDIITISFTPKSISVKEIFHGVVNCGEFFSVSINMMNTDLFDHSDNIMNENLSVEGIMASHQVQSVTGKHAFDVNVIHFQKLNQSIVQVFCNNKVLNVAILIGKEQLPVVEEVEYTTKYPMLNNKESQRAMLIKDNKGDWGIIIGNWRTNDKKNGSSGYLELSLFQLRDNKQTLLFEVESLENVYFIMDDLFVNFFTGHIELKSLNKMDLLPNYISLIFSISILYTLCKPRLLTLSTSRLKSMESTQVYNNFNLSLDIKVISRLLNIEEKSSITPLKLASNDDCNNAQLLIASGYNYKSYVPSNSFFKQSVNSGGCAGCVGSNNSETVIKFPVFQDTSKEMIKGKNNGCFNSDCENDENSEDWT